MEKVQLLNTSVDNLSMCETLTQISYLVENTTRSYVVTPNVDHLVRLEYDMEFKNIYDNATLSLTDGQPLIWISKLYKRPIKEKISGSDLFPKVCEISAKKGYRLFFLGAAEGVADIAARKLTQKYKGLNVVATYSPKPGFEKSTIEVAKIVDMINEKKPDILFLAFGTPKQEKFYYSIRDKVDVPLALAIGASIDFEAGVIQRAPVWMSKCGLEWFYRLCKEPKRMFRRYIIDDMKIFGIVWKYRMQRKGNQNE